MSVLRYWSQIKASLNLEDNGLRVYNLEQDTQMIDCFGHLLQVCETALVSQGGSICVGLEMLSW